ncbi:MAG: penicillin-binding protein 2 [Balneolaceae bacterium]
MSNSRNRKNKTSIRILQVIVGLVWLVLFGRIIQLQIFEYETYSPISKQNHLRQEFVSPARGLILDRNEEILVENEPIFSITINPASFDNSKIPLLARLLETKEEDLVSRIREAQEYSWYRTSRLYTEVSFDVFSNIQENIWQLPGIGHQVESKRHYPLNIKASHALGYLREASRFDYENSSDMRLGDKIGKSGLEMAYENFLKGEIGTEYLRVNAYGQALGTYDDGELNSPPIQGQDLITTLDADLQQLAEQLFQGKKGGAVAMDPRNGEVLTLISSPQYDVERLAGRLDTDYWETINSHENTPLFNRAISTRQPPGSTFKPFMGLAGLHMGLITPDTEVHNNGAYYRGRAYHDLAPVGDYNLERALTLSSNTYFFAMMDRIATRGLLNRWSQLIKDFGIGMQNNIDIPYERSGIVPDSTYMNQTFGEGNWGVGDLMSLGVGQGMVSVSPLQMAVATSVIANGGYKVQPHLVRAIRENDGTLSYPNPAIEKIDWIREEYLATVIQGMSRVITEGSGRFYANPQGITTAGKTGTSQNPHGNNHGWFIAFAPVEDPQIAVAVLVENAGFGSITAAPIASLLIEQYLKGEIERQNVLNYVLNFTPPPEDEDNEGED